MLSGWRMLADHCPETSAVPLMQKRGDKYAFSVATGKYYDNEGNEHLQGADESSKDNVTSNSRSTPWDSSNDTGKDITTRSTQVFDQINNVDNKSDCQQLPTQLQHKPISTHTHVRSASAMKNVVQRSNEKISNKSSRPCASVQRFRKSLGPALDSITASIEMMTARLQNPSTFNAGQAAEAISHLRWIIVLRVHFFDTLRTKSILIEIVNVFFI